MTLRKLEKQSRELEAVKAISAKLLSRGNFVVTGRRKHDMERAKKKEKEKDFKHKTENEDMRED